MPVIPLPKSDPRFDDSVVMNVLGIEKTNLETTMADMVRWMYTTGRIEAKHAGVLTSQ